MKIWTDDECIEVDPNDVGQLEAAMLFKAEHIKAKADPELFTAVADMLDELWDVAIRWADVVRCWECKYHKDTSITEYEHCCLTGQTVGYDDFCSYGEKRRDKDGTT